MHIEWRNLGAVFVASLGLVTVVVALFSLGIAALVRSQAVGEPGRTRDGRRGAADPLARASAVFCFAVCAAVGGYGIYLIVPQAH